MTQEILTTMHVQEVKNTPIYYLTLKIWIYNTSRRRFFGLPVVRILPTVYQYLSYPDAVTKESLPK